MNLYFKEEKDENRWALTIICEKGKKTLLFSQKDLLGNFIFKNADKGDQNYLNTQLKESSPALMETVQGDEGILMTRYFFPKIMSPYSTV